MVYTRDGVISGVCQLLRVAVAADNGELGLTFTETQEMMTSQQGVTPSALPSPLPSAWLHPGAAEDMAT